MVLPLFCSTTSSIFGNQLKQNQSVIRFGGIGDTVCKVADSSTTQPRPDSAERDENNDSWRTGKVRAFRPIRGVRRASQATVQVQGQRKRANMPVRMPPRVRITSGTARGRKLISPNVYLRPMMGKVREAVFSMLTQLDAIRKDGTVLDLFAGLGSVGLEALSRGYTSAVFVDSSPDCVATIRGNAIHCGLGEQSDIVCARVEDFLAAARSHNNDDSFSLITITPPYEEVDYSELLTAVAKSDAVGEGTFVVVEYPVELGTLPPSIGHRLVGIRNRRYGRTIIAIYGCQPSTSIELRPEEFID